MATLIYYDESAHKSAQQNATDVAARFTDLLKDYLQLNIPTPATTEDLPALLADPAIWLVQKWMTGGTFSLGGLPMNPNKVLELLERPAGFDSFIEKGKALAEQLRGQYNGYVPLVRSAASYAVVGGWQVSLSAAAATALAAQFKRYTTNAKQDALLADLLTVCDVVNRLRTTGAVHHDTLQQDGFISKALKMPGHGAEAIPARVNPDFITSKFNY